MPDLGPFERALHEQLLRLPLRPPPRRRRVWVASTAAAAVAAVMGVVALFGASPASAEVEVTIEGGRVEVLLTDLSATPEDVANAVTEAGLDAEVIGAPAGPSNVGRFVQVLVDGDGTTPIQRIQGGVDTFMGFSLPEGWDGTLVIALGRPARPGEVYTVASDAFADGEPLHCSGLLGRRLAEAAEAIEGLNVRLQPLDDGHLVPPIELTGAALREFGQRYVTRGFATSPEDVLLQLVPTAPPAPAPEPGC